MSKLVIKNLNAWYGLHSVLRGINLEIAANTVTAIIGPSGCGKSTLVRCLNRMHEVVPNGRLTGELLLDGKDICKEDAVLLRRKVGMVFQKPNPFPTMSIYDNVAAGLKLNGMRNRDEIDGKVEASLRQSVLWEEVKNKLHEGALSLSGGQQQRLCIARALAVSPEVLLMDEPCSALDPIATAHIEELIHSLRQHYTIIIVTHNMQQAARASDMAAFLYMGELIEYGETKAVFTNPTQKRTEDYITGRFG
jgi:phosphate transport system ATP-binding protein